MDGIGHLSTDDPERRITGLVSPFAYSHRHSAILKHFRHEWQLIQPATGVQCGEDLLFRSYLHQFTGAEPERRRKWVIPRGLHSERCIGIWWLQEFGRAHKAGRAHKGNEVKQMPRFGPQVWRTSRRCPSTTLRIVRRQSTRGGHRWTSMRG
jgi:hypothetical protein